MSECGRGPFRRTRLGAVGVLLAVGVTWVVTDPGGASDPIAPGRGNASGQTVQVHPKAGSLVIGVTLGEALAGHQNHLAKAQSQAIDLGAIGTSLTGYNCGKNPQFQPNQLPQPLIVESGEPHADVGITQTEEAGAFSKFGKAVVTPYSEAITTSAPVSIAGVIAIGAATSTSWSGMVKGERLAGASVSIAGITLPGGVTISGLQWDAVFPSGGTGKPTGSFSVAKVAAPGAPSANPLSGLDALNAVLKPLGLELQVPSVHVTSGILYVDPLTINVIPNSTRDSLLNSVLSGIQPIRQPLIDAVLKAYCQADTEITVADVAIGSISGAGSFTLALGGVQANSGEINSNGFNLGLPGLSLPSLNTPPELPPTAPTPAVETPLSTPDTSPPPATVAPAPAAQVPERTQSAIQPIKSSSGGKRGGALALVGLIGLGLLALLAEGDRRMMRRAQRAATVEV